MTVFRQASRQAGRQAHVYLFSCGTNKGRVVVVLQLTVVPLHHQSLLHFNHSFIQLLRLLDHLVYTTFTIGQHVFHFGLDTQACWGWQQKRSQKPNRNTFVDYILQFELQGKGN